MVKDSGKRVTVKLPVPVYDQARKLSAIVSRLGWKAFGIDREDPATLIAIFEESVNLLTERAKTAERK